jgi:hypothetical protein
MADAVSSYPITLLCTAGNVAVAQTISAADKDCH